MLSCKQSFFLEQTKRFGRKNTHVRFLMRDCSVGNHNAYFGVNSGNWGEREQLTGNEGWAAGKVGRSRRKHSAGYMEKPCQAPIILLCLHFDQKLGSHTSRNPQ